MPTLLQKVRSGVRAGTALWLAGAGCSDSMTRPTLEVDASSDANVVEDAAHDGGQTLQPYLLSAVECVTQDGGVTCCYYANCHVSEIRCPGLDESPPVGVDNPPCGTTGPFAPNPDDLNAAPGNCCYLVGGQVVEGRPLFVDHDMLVAPIALRGDWGLA